jgi:dTDP-N-acetylfucosamine:lipid II N-acetylfucosaminyltransferase
VLSALSGFRKRNKQRIWHIVLDEKFIDYVIEQFEAVAPGASRYITSAGPPTALSSIRRKEYMEFIPDRELRRRLETGRDLDLVIFHSLFGAHAVHACATHPRVCVVATLWGGDVYTYILGKKLFGPGTWAVLETLLDYKDDLRRDLLIESDPLSAESEYFPDLRRALLRANRVAATARHEYAILEKWLEHPLEHLHVDYIYGSMESILGPLFRAPVDQVHKSYEIMAGHSSAETANHLDTFLALKALDTSPLQTWVSPLGYGGYPAYAYAVRQLGARLNGDGFRPLLGFVPREEYNHILCRARAAVYMPFRQQAIGNILTCLWLGTQVFLSRRNPLLCFLRDLGMSVREIESELDARAVAETIPPDEVVRNRECLRENFGWARVQEHARTIVKLVE